ncbi:winged helix-turn-helix transcriptional regulator [Vibrio splendidus]|uniref:winged helix-turn-helix transcriptional regulator n=1 Tax=Vibrio splendidus TaxID=29497 RepID=UPI0010557607|nr:winged helix-turn-helix transcriptional regulator [Vibrio splendidus]
MSFVKFSQLSIEEAKRFGRNGAIASGYKPYSQSEDSYLVDNYHQLSNAEISAVLGRSKGSIIARVKKLTRDGLMSYKPMYFKTRYTREEDEYIIANQESMSFRQVAIALGRNLSSVKDRARRLGVSYIKIADTHHKTKYTADDIEMMRQLRDYDLSFAEIGDKFGAAGSHVRRICSFELRLYQDKTDFLSAVNRQVSAIDSND